jgi:hypothetical protein
VKPLSRDGSLVDDHGRERGNWEQMTRLDLKIVVRRYPGTAAAKEAEELLKD